jgi:hypothetical protein
MIYYNMYKTALYTLWALLLEAQFSWLRAQNIHSISYNTAAIYSCACPRIVASYGMGLGSTRDIS